MKQILFALLILGLVGCAIAPTISPPPPTKTPTRTATTTSTPTATFTPSATPTLPPYPVAFSIDPPSGPIAGGTEITISGVNFSGATVQLDGKNLTPLEQSETSIRIVAPTHDNGIAVIKLQTSLGTGYGEFLYLPPSLNEIQPGDITTVAGIGEFFGEGRLGPQAPIGNIVDFALASDGSIFMAEPQLARIMRLRPDGVIKLYVGTGFGGYSPDDIPALETQLSQARGIALDKKGNLIFADAFTNRVRRVDAITNIVTTIAGTGVEGFSGDGRSATEALLNSPNHPVVDNEGNIFFLDFGNYRIRKIASDGIITTIAGIGTPGYSGDGGPAIEAELDTLFVDAGGLALDPDGNVYLADTNNNVIRKIDITTGIITTVASGEYVREVRAIAFDQAGDLYFSGENDEGPRIIQMRDGKIVKTYGEGKGFSEDGTPAATMQASSIDRIRIDPQGNILFTESTGLVRKINVSTGLLETIAGIGPHVIGENGPALYAQLHLHHSDLAFLPNGNLLIADANNHRVWQMDPNGTISAYIGTGLSWINERVNVAIEHTIISFPVAIEISEDGSIYIIGDGVRKIDSNGVVTQYAGVIGGGDSGPDFSGDGGPAREAQLLQPWDIALDADGNLYIADTNNNRIRRVDAVTKIITTVAGSGEPNGYENYGAGSFCGDNGPAIEACLNTPMGVAVDADGNLYIADSQNSRIRKVDQDGIITTFVDFRPYGGFPTKMVFDSEGNLHAGCGNLIFKIDPTGQITILAGYEDSEGGFSGDGGPATEAQLELQGQADGIAIDAEGNLYFVDAHNRRVRVIKLATAPTP